MTFGGDPQTDPNAKVATLDATKCGHGQKSNVVIHVFFITYEYLVACVFTNEEITFE